MVWIEKKIKIGEKKLFYRYNKTLTKIEKFKFDNWEKLKIEESVTFKKLLNLSNKNLELEGKFIKKIKSKKNQLLKEFKQKQKLLESTKKRYVNKLLKSY